VDTVYIYVFQKQKNFLIFLLIVNDLHIKLTDAKDRSQWRELESDGTGATAIATVMARVKYNLYVSCAGSLRLTWI